jgi:hypothetical protein
MTNQNEGVATLDLKASQESNQRKESHEQAVDNIATSLKAKGYVENPRLLRTKDI